MFDVTSLLEHLLIYFPLKKPDIYIYIYILVKHVLNTVASLGYKGFLCDYSPFQFAMSESTGVFQ